MAKVKKDGTPRVVRTSEELLAYHKERVAYYENLVAKKASKKATKSKTSIKQKIDSLTPEKLAEIEKYLNSINDEAETTTTVAETTSTEAN